MPFFIATLPLFIKRAEHEFAELVKKPSSAAGVADEKDKAKEDHAGEEDVANGSFEPNPVVDKVRLMLQSDNTVGALTWIEQNNEALLMFAVTGDAAGERIMRDLGSYGVGQDFGSLNIFDLQAQFPKADVEEKEQTFLETVKSRVMVENVVQQTKAQAVFSFDFLALCVVASILAAVGLAIDSAVVVVASMLVSPIMGPILAVTFGSVVHDWKLVRVGVLSELLSLMICVMSGFVVGLCFANYGPFFNWPTNEMAGRGSPVGLLVGLAIALPSGIGVALSVLGNNTSSLVGVAISASLLPPAVNCGMCYAYALVGKALHPDKVDAMQFVNIGSISFLLTILNIACVYVAAYGMYKVKEVVPLPGKSHFWTKDVAVARHLHALGPDEANKLQNELQRVLNEQRNARTLAPQTLSDLTMAAIPASLSSLTWHPADDKPHRRRANSDGDVARDDNEQTPDTGGGARAGDGGGSGSAADKRDGTRLVKFDTSHKHGDKPQTAEDMPVEMAAMFAPPESPAKDDRPPESLSTLFAPMSPRADDNKTARPVTPPSTPRDSPPPKARKAKKSKKKRA
eukprot:TRINITY_DN4771_c0_g1_i1.p1 TRINITY_DN4771_c0_g1~~TRINITY_DN4771_c0_g1_i1.p1  ORF type:complete len:571 (+),score=328.91 TRINITY_DN4771_c0_g1_i1:84-1796(+)